MKRLFAGTVAAAALSTGLVAADIAAPSIAAAVVATDDASRALGTSPPLVTVIAARSPENGGVHVERCARHSWMFAFMGVLGIFVLEMTDCLY